MNNPGKKSMRILYVITKGNFGGAQRYVHELALSMREQGHQVTVACGGGKAKGGTRESSQLINKLDADKIPVIFIRSFTRDFGFIKDFYALRELYDAIKKYTPDIVHLNSSKAGVLGALAARLASPLSKIIFTAHGWPFLERRNTLWRIIAWVGSWLTSWLTDTIIVVSTHDLKKTPIPFRKKTSVIHPSLPQYDLISRNAAREKLFSDDILRYHEHDLWLVTIAELTQNKNIHAVIEALKKLKEVGMGNIFYTVIGEGEDEILLKEYVSSHELINQVVFLGHVDNARAYLRAFDAFILPSKKEGFPYALLEAGYASLPVIATKTGGIPEILEHHVHGMVVKPTLDQIICALHEMVQHYNTAAAMGHSLHAKVVNLYTLEKMVYETKNLYTGTISRTT